MAEDEMVRCVCGMLHPVKGRLGDIPIVVCPMAPPDEWFLVNPDYCRYGREASTA